MPSALGLLRNALLLTAVTLAVVSVLIWWVLVRPISPQSAIGTIVGKTYHAPGEYTRLRTGPRREVWSREKINLPEGYVFDIDLGNAKLVHYGLSDGAAAEFNIGQKVRIEYEERKLPYVWKRAYVRKMMAVGP
ncbi:MAG: hypothetical protein ACJ746_15915 [Bryobacteraceae bacterium]